MMRNSRRQCSGCFSGVVRLLLCKGSPQTHPSDQIGGSIELDQVQVKKDRSVQEIESKAPVSSTPNVVARLMGLDSLPETCLCAKGRNLDSVPRSRSVNFMDYLLELDLEQAQHRRVRTSVSFREPTLASQGNYDLLVLYLDKEHKSEKMEHKHRKPEVGESRNDDRKSKNRETSYAKKHKNHGNKKKVSDKQFSRFNRCQEGRVSQPVVSPGTKRAQRQCSSEKLKAKRPEKPINQKEVLVESKFMKKMKNHRATKEVQTLECSSEASCPVSVSDDSTRSKKLHSKKKPSSKATNPETAVKTFYESWKKQTVEQSIKVYKLTEEEVKESNWRVSNAESAEICAEFGQEFLDLLLYQVVEELVN
ncbi:hypothetical protein K2173_008426 [Erythroxylum novogranatense]|uniref:DUF3741 domain-containing protein n=1 Tax=Erythroxylum novogranatense TaxID=1862640 RepID=A0AAV8UC96_9ROSI|nr:hypothetical protein K2173_008426 [Erythroxylum novogranatense]